MITHWMEKSVRIGRELNWDWVEWDRNFLRHVSGLFLIELLVGFWSFRKSKSSRSKMNLFNEFS